MPEVVRPRYSAAVAISRSRGAMHGRRASSFSTRRSTRRSRSASLSSMRFRPLNVVMKCAEKLIGLAIGGGETVHLLAIPQVNQEGEHRPNVWPRLHQNLQISWSNSARFH